MGCGSCSTGGCGTTKTPKGCNNNGSCQTGGCNKMNSFDWLSNMSLPSFQRFDVVEIKFKGGTSEYLNEKDAMKQLQPLIDYLSANPDKTIFLAGYSGTHGSTLLEGNSKEVLDQPSPMNGKTGTVTVGGTAYSEDNRN